MISSLVDKIRQERDSLEEPVLSRKGDDDLETVDRLIQDGDLWRIDTLGEQPLLTEDGEVNLARWIECMAVAKMLLGNYHDLLGQEDVELLSEIQEKGKVAQACFIQANTGLVVRIAKRYMGQDLPIEDLVQAGRMGLMRAMDKFDWRRGLRFSTYATWWIRQAITQQTVKDIRTIRISVCMMGEIRKMYRAVRELEQRLGRKPTDTEIAEEMGVKLSRLKKMVDWSQNTIPMQSPVDEGREFGDTIASLVPGPDEVVAYLLLKEKIEELLERLRPREEKILRLRFGLGGEREHTQEEIAQKLGLTRARIGQIEAKALRELRRLWGIIRLKSYLGDE